MKKKEILFFIKTPDIDGYLNQWKIFIKDICNNFQKVYFVCCDNLVERNKIKKYRNKKFSNLLKKIKIFIPTDFNSLDLFLKNKRPLIINSVGRLFKFYRLLFYLKKKKIPQIMITHSGNIQGGAGYPGYSSKFPLNLYLEKIMQQKICTILTILGIFPKIDIRFASNTLIYNAFVKNQKRFFKLPSIYKEFVLVKSSQFDENFSNIKKKLREDLILLLDMDVDYFDGITHEKRQQNLINKHYKNLSYLLSELSKTFNKKIIISINPKYNLNNTIQRFKGKYPVVKYKTKELIQKSFLILCFGTSACVTAAVLKKKIIAIRSNIFKEKKYNSDLYSVPLKLKTINIDKKIKINGKLLIRDLNLRIKNYDKWSLYYTKSILVKNILI